MKLLVYRREDCALCELAEAMLHQVQGVTVSIRFLEDDAEAEIAYGWRIPVLRRDDNGAELDWPFDAVKLQRFLGDA